MLQPLSRIDDRDNARQARAARLSGAPLSTAWPRSTRAAQPLRLAPAGPIDGALGQPLAALHLAHGDTAAEARSEIGLGENARIGPLDAHDMRASVGIPQPFSGENGAVPTAMRARSASET
jgi:hypothetical protein